MSNAIILLFPALACILGVYFVIVQKRRAFRTLLATNLVASVLFGVFIAVKVLCCSADPAWWLMPLVLAPVEYWAKFGIGILALAGIMALWLKRQAGRELS